MNLEEKKLHSEIKFKGKIITVCLDDAEIPGGAVKKREVVRHGGGVCVVPITENDEILTVEQFRYPYMEVLEEVPAGKRENGEDPLECGRRELLEETGCTADRFVLLGELYPSPGYCSEIIFMYAAKGLHYGESHPDDDEFLNLKKTPLKDLTKKILSGEIKDAKTQAAVLKVNELKRQGKL